MADDPLEPIWKAEPGRWDAEMAAHLYRRAGFGSTTDEVNAALSVGPEKTVLGLLRYGRIPDDLPTMEFGDLTGATAPLGKKGGGGLNQARKAAIYRDMTPEQRRAFFNLDQTAQRAKLEEMKLWWLDRMVKTKRPLEEKMTLFWHGLFVSSAVTVKNSYVLSKQNDLLRHYATGNYKSLALAVSQDPAMLMYLNNNENKKAHPNENYARELMELFTLGIGNYTENDIKESARSFTGWTNQGDEFYFNKADHDIGPKTFLGRTGNWTGEDIVNIIFEQPACSKYIATRLLKFFGADDPPAEIVEALAKVVVDNQYEISPVVGTLFASKWFYSEDVMLRQIKSPVQLVVGSLKALGLGITDPRQVDNAIKLMGQELFNAPTVKGWDGGRAWINTSTLFARYNLPAYLVTGRLPNTGKKPGDTDMRSQYADFDTNWNPQEDLAAANICTTDAMVDLYIKKLLGTTLDPKKRDDLIEYVNATGDSRSHIHDPIGAESDRRVRALVHLIMAMGEYQLC